MEKVVSLYLKEMSDPNDNWTAEDIQGLLATVANELNLDLTTHKGCAQAKLWAYAILGQSRYGKDVRRATNSQDACSLHHAMEVISCLECVFDPDLDQN